MTILLDACKNGDLEIAKILIEKGADIENAIKNSNCNRVKNILKNYIKKEMYKG
jgi:ankyrin repeat protein